MTFLLVAMMGVTAQANPLPAMLWKVDTTKTADKNAEAAAEKKNKKEEKKAAAKPETDYEKLLKEKGSSVQKGMFTVRQIKGRWFFEVPDSLLGRYFLAVTRFTAVPQGLGKFSGESVSEKTVYFEKRDHKTMLLRAYTITQEANPEDKIYQTLKQSTMDPIVESFAIVQGNKEKGMNMIDVTNLFLKDNNLMGISKTASTSLKLGGQMSDRSYVDTIKTYPINVEIATTRTYSVGAANIRAAATGFVTLGLNTSMVLLPKEPMRRRIWDNRVGYFVNSFTTFSDEQLKTKSHSFISRYRLVPKDIKKYRRGELVEPVNPIVFYIDPATPKKWVPYLIKGVNDWNEAFEAAGFKNAIIGKEWPNDPTMSVDDARYSMIRYLPAEIENAYGPRIVDPRSGEIIEAHICWYHNVMNLLTKWYMIQCGPLDKRAQTMKMDDKLMGELIRFVSSHEVGHSLGLRHNMGASHATPVEKLRDKAWVEKHGHTVSIMDYARFNYVAQPEDGISPKGLFPRINDYDKWAIKWGYQYRPEFKDAMEENEGLMKEVTEVLKNNPRLWFGGEGRDADPRSQTEDLGDDNVKASEYGIKNLKRVIAGLPQWTKEEHDRYNDLREMYKAVQQQFTRYVRHVAKNLGGYYYNNMPGKEPLEVVPAQRQRDAFRFFDRQVFDAPLWLYPSNILSKTGGNVQTEMASMQASVLKMVLGPGVLSSVYNDMYRSPKAYQLNDYFNDLFATVWKPIDATQELKALSRRSLQRLYVDNLNSLLNPTEKEKEGANAVFYKSDLPLFVAQHLDKVEAYVKTQAASATGVNAMHYKDLLQQIKLIRERRVTVK